MNEERNQIEQVQGGIPRWVGFALAVLAVLSLVGVGMAWNAARQADSNEQALASEVQSLRQNLDVFGQQMDQADEVTAQVRGELSVVTDRLKLTQTELNRARQQARQIREEYQQKLTEVESEVRGELATKADSQAVEVLSGDVSGVRGELEATRQHLQMARGELGTLIARNGEEIEQLRRLGLRDYFEFTLDGRGSKQRLGNIMVELRSTNTRKNHYTVALYVDDLRLEKKNRSINEPIYFYTRGTRAPLELVINQVEKNKAIGYLSVPKGATIAATASAHPGQ
jgi:hypothetical protein